jgi:hypothetical protein
MKPQKTLHHRGTRRARRKSEEEKQEPGLVFICTNQCKSVAKKSSLPQSSKMSLSPLPGSSLPSPCPLWLKMGLALICVNPRKSVAKRVWPSRSRAPPSATPRFRLVVVFEPEVRNHLFAAKMTKGVLELHGLDEEIVFRIEAGYGHRRLQVKAQPLLNSPSA